MPRGQKKGFRHSEESKKKISDAIKNRPRLPTDFKKGCNPPPHAFKKGHATWNKDKKFPEIGLARTGENNPNWKGGVKEIAGYIWIYNPSHPNPTAKYVKRANLIMEEHIERFLLKGEIVHHINSNRKDDRIENLYLCKNRSEHMAIHRNS